jgi:hypothetical protein
MDGFQKRWKSWRNRTASNCEGHKKDTAGSGRLPERGNGAKVLGNERFAKSNRELTAEGQRKSIVFALVTGTGSEPREDALFPAFFI